MNEINYFDEDTGPWDIEFTYSSPDIVYGPDTCDDPGFDWTIVNNTDPQAFDSFFAENRGNPNSESLLEEIKKIHL